MDSPKGVFRFRLKELGALKCPRVPLLTLVVAHYAPIQLRNIFTHVMDIENVCVSDDQALSVHFFFFVFFEGKLLAFCLLRMPFRPSIYMCDVQ